VSSCLSQEALFTFSSNALYILSFQVKILLWAEMSTSMAKSSKKKMSAIEELARLQVCVVCV
jgi:hypothetical protein